MENIHSTAIISSKAELGKNISVGPYSIIEDNVKIGDNCIVGPHVTIYNGARIGNSVKIYQGASVSNQPQDLKFDNEESIFKVGDNSIIREFSTLHRGTKESGISKIGKNCLLMAYSHVAHDCIVGDNCILANLVQLGGHVELEDWVIIGGGTVVHQFEKIGQHAMVGGGFRVIADVPPYVMAAGFPLSYNGLNTIGLRRRGFSNKEITRIKEIYTMLFSNELNLSQAKGKIEKTFGDDKFAQNILNFLKKSKRGIIKR
ncbi:MAG: acyl-[acyl-carrier-protein]--UDP-N-acetylglucosamine O-acyltransferase [Ignavibacteriae bacterium]|nr:MAG: acyl-[acyl-carrier-protein]--UDP-N-acetylglucosamine O-acyltransferase [Ignavibacteriota bacterium]